MTAIGPYSMATVPLGSTTRYVPMGKAVDCDSILRVLYRYVPNYYASIVLADMERVYADPDSRYTVFAFDQVRCTSKEQSISYCRDTTYAGEVLPLSLTSSRKFILPTMGTNSLLIESPDGQSIFVNKKPVTLSIACGNGIVYIVL